MQRKCANCHAEASRSSVTFDDKGRVVRECCPHCDPQHFAEPFRAPSDNKIYSGPEAMPNRYKLGSDGVLHATDELIADTAAEWDRGPLQRAIEHKRATRRTEPLSEAEKAATARWAEQVLRPALEQGGLAGAVAVMNRNE